MCYLSVSSDEPNCSGFDTAEVQATRTPQKSVGTETFQGCKKIAQGVGTAKQKETKNYLARSSDLFKGSAMYFGGNLDGSVCCFFLTTSRPNTFTLFLLRFFFSTALKLLFFYSFSRQIEHSSVGILSLLGFLFVAI